MIRTLLFSSMIIFAGQAAALPVLHYTDIQQELAGLKQEVKPLQVLAVIEANIKGNLVSLSRDQKTLLIQELEELKSCLCKRDHPGILHWPLGITASVGIWFLVNYDNAQKKEYLMSYGVSAITQARVDAAWDDTRSAFGWLLFTAAIMLIISGEYADKIDLCFAQERALEIKINGIIALLKQQEIV